MSATDNPCAEGATVVDCGDEGTVEDVRREQGTTVYEIHFEDGSRFDLPESELELGIADGTIQVIP